MTTSPIAASSLTKERAVGNPFELVSRRGVAVSRAGPGGVEGDVEDPAQRPIRLRPRLRGVSHQYAFFASLITGTVLVATAPTGRAVLAAAVYGVSVSAVFGVSALYHRVAWSPRGYRRMKRLDHAMIFVLIAGTFTPFGVLTLSGGLAAVILMVVWSGAAAGIVLKLAWIDAPRWLSAALYVALGWVGVAALPELLVQMGWMATGLLLLGGLLYSAGALIYALRRPDPVPGVFGYHEVFHALVIAAALAQYAVVVFFVLPAS